MSYVVKDKLPQFQRSLFAVLDDAFKEAAKDALIDAKEKAPFKKGGLRGDADVHQKGSLHWRISFGKEYARFQEFGGDSKRRVNNYSTSGTGAHYLRNAGDKQLAKLKFTCKKHAMRAKA